MGISVLLEELARHPSLWDLSNDDYKFGTVRDREWDEIRFIIEDRVGVKKTVEVLKKRWKSIRDEYNKRNKKKPTGSEGGTPKRSKYDEALKFLERAPTHRTGSTNLAPPASNGHDEPNGGDDYDDYGDPMDDEHGDDRHPGDSSDQANTGRQELADRDGETSGSGLQTNRDQLESSTARISGRGQSGGAESSFSPVQQRTATKRKRSNNDSPSPDIDRQYLDVLKRIRPAPSAGASISDHEAIGRLVVGVLDRTRGSSDYPDLLGDQMRWIMRGQRSFLDNDASGASGTK